MTSTQQIRKMALSARISPREFAQIEHELNAIEQAQEAANNCQALASRLYDNFVREHGSALAVGENCKG